MFPYKNEISLNGRTDYKCQTCAKYFFSKINLKRHINIIHKRFKKDFKCDSCEKTFSEKGCKIFGVDGRIKPKIVEIRQKEMRFLMDSR